MFCTQCDSENPAGNRFCGNCGAKLEASTSEAVLSEAKSRPVAPPLDLRDPTDPGRIIVPANGRNAIHVPEDELIATAPESPAYEPETPLDAHSAHLAEERVAAEPVEPVYYMAAADNTPVETAPPRRDTSLHGPSLLGLSDDEFNSNAKDPNSSDYSYLYDDEGGGGRTVNWRLMFALLLLIGFGGLMAYKWSQGMSWNSMIVKATGQKTEPPPIVAKTEPTTPGAPEIAVGETQKPVPADIKPQSDQTAADKAAQSNAPKDGADQSKSADSANPSAAESKPGSTGTDGAAGAKAADTKTADTKGSDKKPEENKVPEDKKTDAAKQAKATEPADNGGDEEDVDQPAPAKASKSSAAAKRGAKAAKVQDPDQDETVLVHRADALLRARSCNEAVDLFREAALHGSATARSRLGGLYATGHCVPLDRAEAYNWFTLAKDAGAHYSWIEHNRSMLWAQMTERERERVMRR